MDYYRFYVADLQAQAAVSDPAKLSAEEAHHARAVLRLAGGERVCVFDGQGASAEGPFVTSGKRDAAVKLERPVRVDDAARRRVTIATAPPKGDRAHQLVEQTSQLNVARLVWMECDRGVAKAGDAKAEKWRRLTIESAKQCGRNYLMEIGPGQTLQAVLQDASRMAMAVLWLEPRSDGREAASVLQEVSQQNVVALVGPEGGWSAQELALLQNGADRGEVRRISLGKNVLRIETACAAIAALLMAQ